MTDENEIKTKKKYHYYDIYISKVLKEVSSSGGITLNARQQLNSILMYLSKLIAKTALDLTIISNKKTISDNEIKRSVKLIFPGQLAIHSITEGQTAVEKYSQETEKKGKSRQSKAGILFPPAITEKFLRNFGYNKIMITGTAPVYMAAVLEYITSEILSIATTYIRSQQRMRITVQSLEVSIMRDDIELSSLFKIHNLHFMGGSVVPYVHPKLNMKKKKTIPKEKKGGHRYRPGIVALREIKKYQKTGDCLMFSKHPFEEEVREIIQSHKDNIKISKNVFLILQYYIEQYLLELLESANLLAIHAGRVKVIPSDIEFILSIRDKRKPLNFLEVPSDTDDSSFITDSEEVALSSPLGSQDALSGDEDEEKES